MKLFRRTLSLPICACFAGMVLSVGMPKNAFSQQTTASLSTNHPSKYSFLQNADMFAGGFAQFTNERVNHVHDGGQSASTSPGVLFRFHKSYHWWLGYDVNYGFSNFTENYYYVHETREHRRVSTLSANVDANANEFTASYRIQGRAFHKLVPYAEGGVGETLFVPTSKYMTIPGYRNSPDTEVSTQHLLTGVYDLGIDAPNLIADHMGARFEYRNLIYNTPGFHQWRGNNVLMMTQEATGGMYFKF